MIALRILVIGVTCVKRRENARTISLNWTKNTKPKMLRRGIQSFGTIDWRIDWREGRNCSRNQTVRSQPMKLADSAMRRRVKAPCGSDLLIAIFNDPNHRQETAPPRRPPTRRPKSHDTQCLWEISRSRTVGPVTLWERSPDRDLRSSQQSRSGDRSHQETAPAAERAARRRDGWCVGSFTNYCRIKVRSLPCS